MIKYPCSIEEAAVILDREKPGWEKKVDSTKLNMRGVRECILGQVFGNYDTAMSNLFNMGDKSADNIFGYMASTEKWTEEINKRLNKKEEIVKPRAIVFPIMGNSQLFEMVKARLYKLGYKNLLDVAENNAATIVVGDGLLRWTPKEITQDLLDGKPNPHGQVLGDINKLLHTDEYKLRQEKLIMVGSGTYAKVGKEVKIPGLLFITGPQLEEIYKAYKEYNS